MESDRRPRCWGDSKTKVQPKWTRGVWSRFGAGDVGQWFAQPVRLVVVGGGASLDSFQKKDPKNDEFPTPTLGMLNVLVQHFLKNLF